MNIIFAKSQTASLADEGRHFWQRTQTYMYLKEDDKGKLDGPGLPVLSRMTTIRIYLATETANEMARYKTYFFGIPQ